MLILQYKWKLLQTLLLLDDRHGVDRARRELLLGGLL
jgi:hypothetical protein